MSLFARFAAGFVLKGVLRKATGRAEPAGSVPPPPRSRPGTSLARTRTRVVSEAPARPGKAFAAMMAGAGIGVPLMLIFDHPLTRIVGVLGLFAFIAAGVFAIASPEFLAADDEERP